MEFRMRSVKCRVWSAECKVQTSHSPRCTKRSIFRARLSILTLGHLRRKGRFCSFPHRLDTAKPEENQRLKTRHVGASKRAVRARLSNFDAWTPSKREGFCGFPHSSRHCEARGKPETPDETCWRLKASICCACDEKYNTYNTFSHNVAKEAPAM